MIVKKEDIGKLVTLDVNGFPHVTVKIVETIKTGDQITYVKVNVVPEVDMIIPIHMIKEIEYGCITDEELDDYGIMDQTQREIIKYRYSKAQKGYYPNPYTALY